MNHIIELVAKEKIRQQQTISLVASENYIPKKIQDIVASDLANKYAEGYPGQRYYAGCKVIDEIESYTIQQCCSLFQAEAANVQPHAGSQANQAVFFAALKPGDTILGMDLSAGGHLTHGYKKNFSGIFYNAHHYSVNPESGLLDLNIFEDAIKKNKPKLTIVGASAYPRIIDFKTCAEIAHRNNSLLLADIAHIAGLVAAQIHPSPLPYADFVTGTTHKTLRGPRGGFILTNQEWIKKINQAVMPGIQGGPHMNSIAAKGACFSLAHNQEFLAYQKHVIANAQILAQSLQQEGFECLTNGTDIHLLIIKTLPHGLTGKEAEERLERIGITSSRSTIPEEKLHPKITSGLRFGTAAATTRGMGKKEMELLARLIAQTLIKTYTPLNQIKAQVKTLAKNFPIPTSNEHIKTR